MKTFHSAVLERRQWKTTDFATEPYEAGWADEAVFFIDAIAEGGGDRAQPALSATPQTSPDGIRWIDCGSTTSIPLNELADVHVTGFAGWVRVRIELLGTDVHLNITLALKG